VAVIGASRRPASFGGATFRHALAAGFRGELYPVNPNVDFIGSRRASASVLDTPGPVELAIVAVPAATVPEVARDCARAGVAGLVVITAGFAEAGAEGAARLAELLDACRAGGMRLVGPNCMGVVNTDPAVSLSATFARADVPAGNVGFASQSGAFGAAAIDGAVRRGIGLSTFVSLGDKADLSGNDMLQYWEQDGATGVVALYLESFGNPRKFGRVARRVARAKPVLVVKAGRTSAGARRAASHTGALLAAADASTEAPACSAATGSTTCSTPPPCSPSSRSRAAGASGSWPTPAGRRSCAPTRAWTPPSRSPRWPSRPGRRCASASRPTRSSPARSSSRSRRRPSASGRPSTSWPPTPRSTP
jgi:acyl-CoA synthetase (NDP forming)